MNETLAILVLSEDTSVHAFTVVDGVLRSLLRHIDPKAYMVRVRTDPLNESRLNSVLQPSKWTSRSAVTREAWVTLVRTIANKLAEPHGEPPTRLRGQGFVVYHFDGDTTWAK